MLGMETPAPPRSRPKAPPIGGGGAPSEGGPEPEAFLSGVLARLVALGPAEAGAVFRIAPGAPAQPVSACQSKQARSPELWLAQAGEVARALAEASPPPLSAVAPFQGPAGGAYYGGQPGLQLIGVQLGPFEGAPHAAVFLAQADLEADGRVRRRLELARALCDLHRAEEGGEDLRQRLDRIGDAVRALDALNEHRRFKAAAMAFCNELAARLGCERVTLGLLRGRYVRALAMSHVEKFHRRTHLVLDIERAMEECVDQDLEVVYPRPEGLMAVTRAAERLSRQHGPSAVATLPLRPGGRGADEPGAAEVTGALVVERAPDRPFTLVELESLRLSCELCCARLLDLDDRDRWVGAKLARASRRGLSVLLGPRHTLTKLVALLVAGAVAAAVLIQGPDRVDANFTLEPVVRRVVPAPFAGKLQSAPVEINQRVTQGVTLLATLETAELHLQRGTAIADRARWQAEADLALRDGKAAERRLADLNARKAQAQIDLLEHQIAQARVVAPISGVVLQGDLRRHLGKPLEAGETLYEIAPLDALRAELEVPEDRIADLRALAVEGGAGAPGDPSSPGEASPAGGATTPHGHMVTLARPGVFIPFWIEQVHPVAEVIEEKNVFKVRVRLLSLDPTLKPGMRGLAKVDVGRRSYAAIWTRRLVDWLRMQLWV